MNVYPPHVRSLCVLLLIIIFIHVYSGLASSQSVEEANRLYAQYTQLQKEGRYKEAIPIAGQVLAIYEKAFGPEHLSTAAALNGLAELYRNLGDYQKALPLYDRSLAIYEKVRGPEHQDVATILNNLAFFYRTMGNYQKSEDLYRRALSIYEKALGPDHSYTATSLNGLADLYRVMGDYQKALPLYERSLSIYEKALGPGHSNVATALTNLAELYRTMGNYQKAEELYGRSLGIYEKTLGPDHQFVATALYSLAELYRTMGSFQKAEELYKRALSIYEKALGPDHSYTVTAVYGLAELYRNMGDFQRAEPLYKRALVAWEKSFGPDHRHVATALYSLAELYRSTGQYGRARDFYKRALSIYRQTLGPGHQYTATALYSLTELYRTMGYFKEAEELYKQAIAIYEKALGPNHSHTATAMSGLAELYRTTGEYQKAEPLSRRTLEIWEKAFGPDHPNVATGLNNLGILYAALGRYDNAFTYMLRAQDIDRKLIDQVMSFTSEDQKLKFLATREGQLSVFLTLVAGRMRDRSDARAAGFTVWLQRKGVVLEAQKRFQDALVFSDDPGIVAKFQELARVRSQLSKLTFSGPGKESVEVYRRKIEELEAKKRELEAELSKASEVFARSQKVSKADVGQVAGALPGGSVLVDFARLPIFSFTARGMEKRWLPSHYIAFIVPSGRASEVSIVDLGSADEIDRLIRDFKTVVGNYQTDPEGKESSRLARKLCDRIFQPLVKELKGAREIYLSPDGNLNLIPFEVLKSPDGRYLIEDYTFNYLGSGRDVLGFGIVKGRSSEPLIIGDPDYDLDEKSLKEASQKLGIKPAGKRSTAVRSRDMSSQGFSSLPGTREEVESIASILGKKNIIFLTGPQALEEVLYQRKDPRFLHLATHGFFLTDQDLLLAEKGQIKFENPLVRSGIVLAGANRSLRSGSDEGIVTAEKVLSLRLSGTEFVVLSACETGLGDIKRGEGVFGLRRAFTQAGAKGLVMSLWSVPDRETKEIMVKFYSNVLTKKMKGPRALRQAILTELSTVRDRYGNTNPFFWGAFVYMGEP